MNKRPGTLGRAAQASRAATAAIAGANAPTGGGERRSRLTAAIDAKPRDDHGPFELPRGFVAPSMQHVANVKMRVLVKTEEDASLIAAYQAVAKLIEQKEGAEAATSDADLLNDNKAIHALYKACRDADDPMYPAFFDQEWMRSKFSTDKIAYLLNLYFAARNAEEVMRWQIDSEDLEKRLHRVAIADQDTAIPEAIIADCTEAWLRQAFILAGMRLLRERRALWRTRQLLATAVEHLRAATPETARALDAFLTAAAGELGQDEPWGTQVARDATWVGVPLASTSEAAIRLRALSEAARAIDPGATDDEAELEAAQAARVEVEDELETPEASAEEEVPGELDPGATPWLPTGAIIREGEDPDEG